MNRIESTVVSQYFPSLVPERNTVNQGKFASRPKSLNKYNPFLFWISFTEPKASLLFAISFVLKLSCRSAPFLGKDSQYSLNSLIHLKGVCEFIYVNLFIYMLALDPI